MRRAWLLSLLAACEPRPPSGSCVELPPSSQDLGFDTIFSLRLRPACVSGSVTWKQIAGVDAGLTATGSMATAHTPSRTAALGGEPPWGVVPFSPRTQGQLAFAVRWQAPGGHFIEEEVRVAAAARARGLPNVPVGARVHLGGRGWTLSSAPPDSAVRAISGDALVPDVTGEWRLSDGEGRTLLLRSGRYDETPLDCGRSGCHPAVAAAAAASPMTTTLARRLREGGSWQCALACHATGEPRVPDGGFWHVSSELGHGAVDRWEDTPRPLRRLGGVGCLACHGPGAVPEESARWSILRADVCATCHDAPPRYGHVAAWRRSRMATADRDPRTSGPTCLRCHTTAGYLASIGVLPGDRRPPPAAGPTGITCAACHAAHGAIVEGSPLLRQVAAPAWLGPVPRRSGACVRCHAPDAEVPSSSSAAVWLGRGGLDPRSGRPLDGPAPHASIEGGCLACHRAGPGAGRGDGHAFTATLAACAGCHGPQAAGSDLQARAARLWSGLGPPTSHPPHANSPAIDRATTRGRAAWNLLLVLEDPGAASHNPRYARRLLDAAEEALR